AVAEWQIPRVGAGSDLSDGQERCRPQQYDAPGFHAAADDQSGGLGPPAAGRRVPGCAAGRHARGLSHEDAGAEELHRLPLCKLSVATPLRRGWLVQGARPDENGERARRLSAPGWQADREYRIPSARARQVSCPGTGTGRELDEVQAATASLRR